MFLHLLKTIWHRKSKNGLLVLEIFLAFLILFSVTTVLLRGLDNFWSPLGHQHEAVWNAHLNYYHLDTSEVTAMKPRLKQELLALPEVDAVSFSHHMMPFGNSQYSNMSDDNGYTMQTHLIKVDHDYTKVMGFQPSEGRWFEPGDETGKYPPVVITQMIRDEYPDPGWALDSVNHITEESRILGVVDHFRYQGQFKPEVPLTFQYAPEASYGSNMLLIRVNDRATAAFEPRLVETIVSVTGLDDVSLGQLENRRVEKNRPLIILAVSMLIISGFLIFNIALGLFGSLYNSIRKRRGEIGLRRALGAYRSSITKQLMLEVWILAGLGMVAGALLCVQVPLMDFFDLPDRYFYWSIVVTFCFISLLVLLCAVYPGVQAGRLHPAEALREE